jgi:carbon monoxide dehydrogenase subunit G
MITIDERIDISASPDTVWRIMSDPHQVVACVPGASLGESHEDGSFDGALTVQFGPLKIAFKARIKLDLDPAARSGHLVASGKDGQGGTRLQTTADFQVDPAASGDGATVTMGGEVEIKGRLAGLVEGGANVVVRRMTDQFTERLTARCREAEAATRV